MLLTVKQISDWMKENNIPGGSIKNIYKRMNSGREWGFVFDKGLFKVSEENLERIWKENPVYMKKGRKRKAR